MNELMISISDPKLNILLVSFSGWSSIKLDVSEAIFLGRFYQIVVRCWVSRWDCKCRALVSLFKTVREITTLFSEVSGFI